MKVWVLAGLFTAATVPFAAAAETTEECQLDESRRGVNVQRIDSTPDTNVGGGGGGVPAVSGTTANTATAQVTVARPTSTIREAAAQTAREDAQRRRNGKRVPDAELIGPRGAL